MRYFYYGNKENKRKETSYGMQPAWTNFREEDLVEEEDTIYEIDRHCEECQKRMQERMGYRN
jgi:hypothetical protein